MSHFPLHYVWLNPVIGAMAGTQYPLLLHQLRKLGFHPVQATAAGAWVHQAYRNLALGTPPLLIDARCPEVVRLVENDFPALLPYIAPIQPILLRCAAELYERYVAPSPQTAQLTMVTPCHILAEQGRMEFGEKIFFATWQAFAAEHDLRANYARPNASPIPPGFFRNLPLPVTEASGAAPIRELLQSVEAYPEQFRQHVLELLFCPDGCHNGDGLC